MRFRLFLLCGAMGLAAAARADELPHLERRGQATQLIVDRQPFLILGGEVANTASSDPAYMETVWPKLVRLNLNTVLAAVAWSWVEPEEGEFDFNLVDGLLDGARRHDLRLVLLWFGSWKNGLSSFAPAWVKADTERFPRVRLADGRPVEILSPLSPAVVEADTRAYVKFLEHLREVDPQHTVLMIQLQNEVGVLGDSRDRSGVADTSFAGQAPESLIASLRRNREHLNPALRRKWNDVMWGGEPTWTDAFGSGPETDEIFMAWHYASAMGAMAAAGKAVHPLPVFTNTWIVQPEDRGPGDYPSGGPQPLTLDVWKIGAPAIDFSSPDVYLPDFPTHAAAFHRPDNPLFIPESRGDAAGIANAFQAIGAHAALGYSPFGIDQVDRLGSGAELEDLPLARGYGLLRDLTPLILSHQSAGTLAAAWVTKEQPRQEVVLGNYTLSITIRQNRRTGTAAADRGYALIFAVGPDEYIVAGTDVQVTFLPREAGEIAGIASAEAGQFVDRRWQARRQMSGDDILLDYRLAVAAAERQSGSGLKFGASGPAIQRVTLYRYR